MSSASASAAAPSTSSVAGLTVAKVPWLPLVSLPSMSSELAPSASNAIVASAVILNGHMSGLIQSNIVFGPSKRQESLVVDF